MDNNALISKSRLDNEKSQPPNCANSLDPDVHLHSFDLSNTVCVIYFFEAILECSKNVKL